MNVDSQIAHAVGVASVFVVVPAKNLGVNYRDLQSLERKGIQNFTGEARNMSKVNIDKSCSGMIKLSLNNDRGINTNYVCRNILLFRLNKQTLRAFSFSLLVDIINSCSINMADFPIFANPALKSYIQNNQ